MDKNHRFAYALPTIAVSFLMSPMAILQGVYAKYFGLALTTIASVLLIARLFDAVTDPVIGYWSDHHYARTGSRKLFVICGGLLMIISSYFLYVPFTSNTVSESNHVSTVYFLCCFLAFYLAWTLFEIPHLAWGGELSPDFLEKNKTFTVRALATHSGSLLFYIIPLLPFFDTPEFTPETLKWSVIIASLLMVPMLYSCVKFVPNGDRVPPPRDYILKKSTSMRKSRSRLTVIIWSNRPLLLFITAFVFAGIGIGMWFGVIFIYIDSYLSMGNKFALIYMVSMITATLSLIVWNRLANWIGKKYAWGISLSLMCIGVFCVSLFSPNESNWLHLLFIIILIKSGYAAAAILAPSLLGDISDYGVLKFGREHAATYFSIYTLAIKTSAAIGSALSLAIAGWYEFEATAIIHSERSVFGLILAGSWLPPLFLAAAVLVISFTPINARRHSIIRRRLDRRVVFAASEDKQQCKIRR